MPIDTKKVIDLMDAISVIRGEVAILKHKHPPTGDDEAQTDPGQYLEQAGEYLDNASSELESLLEEERENA